MKISDSRFNNQEEGALNISLVTCDANIYLLKTMINQFQKTCKSREQKRRKQFYFKDFRITITRRKKEDLFRILF